MNERDIELAKQAIKYALGLNPEEDAYGNPLNRDKFPRDRDACFADLIRADEREACAKVCEDLAAAYQREHETAREDGADSCAIAILARGNK